MLAWLFMFFLRLLTQKRNLNRLNEMISTRIKQLLLFELSSNLVQELSFSKKQIKQMGLSPLALAVITWYKDNRPLSGSTSVAFLNRGQIIEIESAQIADAGIYKCVAINSAGATELYYSLQVHGECCFSCIHPGEKKHAK